MLCRLQGRRDGNSLAIAVASDDAPAIPFVPRVVDIVSTAAGEFLRPPAAERARWAGAAHEALCTAGAEALLAAAYQRILDNDPQPGEVALFGRYLAEALLGPNLDLIEQHADAVDLRLALNAPSLERLPWEMMHAASGPLAARPAHRISITREVKRGAADPAAAQVTLDLPLPLRVLFVVGATIDPVLRPGAEFLGLLRHLQIPVDPGFTQFRNANVHIRYLGDADVDALKHQLHIFQPSVVHFICHGERQAGTGDTRIVLKQIVAGAGGPVKQKLSLSSGELFDAFEDAGIMPPIVVLNACHAGGANASQPVSGDGHLPFAADLVRRGVAIAVGMAGEVEDRACQLFARRFYQALLAHEAITVATAQARRAVLAAWPGYQQSVEWARPTVFVAAGIDPTVGTSAVGTLDIIERAGRFRQVGTSPEMLCDRYEVLAAAQELFELADHPGNDRLLVAIRVDADVAGLGKTRLLEEIAVRSVFDRFVPVIIRAEGGDPPQTFLEFALAISEAMDETRRNLTLDKVLRTRARLVAFDVVTGSAAAADGMTDAQFNDERHKLRNRLRAMVPSGGGVAASRVRDAIGEDCARLAADAGARTGTRYRVLILIDELHRYAGAVDPILDNIQYAGFGTEEAPIPVVVNYLDLGSEGETIRKKLQHLPLGRRPDLKRFELELERQLAYRQLIVSAFSVTPNQRRDKKAAVEDFFARLHKTTGGRPGEFTGLKVEYFMTGAMIGDTLVDANYEDILRQFGDK
jgi:hypothetical protein